ncbi:MAG: NlpC/P60 family protein [Acidimicrobiia bacterium]|nr:NlpC/P60 family protein [Acidimicrobiia bacterium]
MTHPRALRCGGHGRLVVIVLAASSLAACARSGMVYTPHPFPVPGGRPVPVATPAPTDPTAPPVVPPPGRTPAVGPRSGNADGDALSGTAMSLRGAPYKNGGIDPNGFDCSGFVRYVYAQHGVPMPREVREQFKVGKTIARSRLEPGDLVFFSTVAPGASHVGIVIGGDQFVHAPSERGVVRVESLAQQYWASRFIGAKRVS